MNYIESIQFLETEIGFASCPGLERVAELLKRMGNPQNSLSITHVAGTNGKGSATAMLSSILQEAGYKTGAYTSPHLERYNERFVIDGVEITDDDFSEIITEVRTHWEEMKAENLDLPTLFEVVTVAAFLYFAKKQVDVLILEVGLGGRFDATNIVETPLISLIMSISIDHTDFLGNTLGEIAKEKAGIIKKNCPVVLYSQEELVYNIVQNTAILLDAPFHMVEEPTVIIHSETLEGTCFSVHTKDFAYKQITLSLLGKHQVQNCIAVLETCFVLQEKGLCITQEHVISGLAKTKWAGRLEIIGQEPLLLIDGAHNRDGIYRLSECIATYFTDKQITLVLGVLGDKEYEDMANSILPYASRVILTEPHSHRKLAVGSLAEVAQKFEIPMFLEEIIENAIDKAISITPKDDVILCCGSLYLIGDIRKYILSTNRGGTSHV
ncbi:folylpolyglutamate synthase/dihydrofolate synthase family protein [Chakrabartyella piscis]|uniref:bifunctional folylpolyglutamate synthase/dihydrofolate synthase n=1 Tax=Chakrabartyella piscis TaxID=2918914 RepID=UPI00295831C8|nr:folylpolyglutamate synthase/dihydrofolate synthase family protein [Chakrabartyella piscis]